MKWIDIPPVWLFCCAAIAFAQSRYASFGLGFPGPVPDFLGGVLVGGGLILIALAVYEFRRARTTVIPHMTPTHLVSSGIFSRTRNPIYLADLMILAGLILRWDAVLALPLVPILMRIIEVRFIVAEEDRMRRTFRQEWARYSSRVRRWL